MEFIREVILRFVESLGPVSYLGIIVIFILTVIALTSRRPDVALLCLFGLSLLTAAESPVLSSVALLGRWYFLLVAALIAIFRPGKVHGIIIFFMVSWAMLNIIGIFYSPYKTAAVVRALYFALVIPAFMISMGPPNYTIRSLIDFVRHMGIIGIILAILHFVFIVIAPQGSGIERFKSFFTSAQAMSLATAMATLPMLWALLSRQAGRLTIPFVVATAVNLLVMVASTQRAGLFSVAIGVAVLLLFYRLRGVGLVVLGTVFAVLIAWPIITYLVPEEYLVRRLTTLEAESRLVFWRYAFQGALESPFIGHGSGAATFEGTIRFGMKFHQAYLATFYDLGIVGCFVFLGMLVSGVLVSLRLVRSYLPARRAIGVFLLASFCQIAAQGMVETGLADTANQTAVMFYISLGLAGAAANMEETFGEEVYLEYEQSPREEVVQYY